MTRTFAIALLCVAFITVATPAAAFEGKRLTTEAEFRDLVADRDLTADRTIVSYSGDGQIEGETGDRKIKGMWLWAGKALCRTVTVGTKNLGLDCQAVFLIGDLVVLVRKEGLGAAFALRIRREGTDAGKIAFL